jgi:hypothetical protein
VRAVSRLYMGLSKQIPPELDVRIERINGRPSALLSVHGILLSVMQVQVEGQAGNERIVRIDNVVNPRKLARVAAAFGLRTSAP